MQENRLHQGVLLYTHIQVLLPEIKTTIAQRKYSASGHKEIWSAIRNPLQKEFTFNLQEVLHLSIIRAPRDNNIAVYKIGAQQTVNLIPDAIRLAIKKRGAVELQLRSAPGLQYTAQAYFHLIKQYCIAPAMPREGNFYNNVISGNFLFNLKTKCIYRHKPSSCAKTDEMFDRFISAFTTVSIFV